MRNNTNAARTRIRDVARFRKTLVDFLVAAGITLDDIDAIRADLVLRLGDPAVLAAVADLLGERPKALAELDLDDRILWYMEGAAARGDKPLTQPELRKLLGTSSATVTGTMGVLVARKCVVKGGPMQPYQLTPAGRVAAAEAVAFVNAAHEAEEPKAK